METGMLVIEMEEVGECVRAGEDVRMSEEGVS